MISASEPQVRDRRRWTAEESGGLGQMYRTPNGCEAMFLVGPAKIFKADSKRIYICDPLDCQCEKSLLYGSRYTEPARWFRETFLMRATRAAANTQRRMNTCALPILVLPQSPSQAWD